MGLTSRAFKLLISVKNRQLRLEREKNHALEETNSILSAYLAVLIEKNGEARVPRRLVRDAIGNYRACVEVLGDDYLIRILRPCGDAPVADGGREAAADESDAERGDSLGSDIPR